MITQLQYIWLRTTRVEVEVRKCVKEKKMVIEHIITKLMLADPLTKGMPPKYFKDHVVQMGLGSMM